MNDTAYELLDEFVYTILKQCGLGEVSRMPLSRSIRQAIILQELKQERINGNQKADENHTSITKASRNY